MIALLRLYLMQKTVKTKKRVRKFRVEEKGAYQYLRFSNHETTLA